MTMNRFVHEQNLSHLRALLARTTDEAECQRIVGLIDEEEANNTSRDPLRDP